MYLIYMYSSASRKYQCINCAVVPHEFEQDLLSSVTPEDTTAKSTQTEITSKSAQTYATVTASTTDSSSQTTVDHIDELAIIQLFCHCDIPK